MSDHERSKEPPIGWAAFPQLFGPAVEYATDFVQRQILFWDTLRQRGNQYRDHSAKLAPHVLNYSFEVVADGRTFKRPVNYVLVRIDPPEDVEINPKARPFVIVDPRAGHGPGIGGFKADSEIGVAMKAGHPCYFVGFLPEPMEEQTIEDIGRAEAIFLEKVIALASRCRWQAMRDRKLPGGLGCHDARGDQARTVRAAHHCRLPALLLGRRPGHQSDALLGRPARRKLVDGANK